MAEQNEAWKRVSSKAEALGLKLKLHLEQEAEAADDQDDAATEGGSTRASLEDFGHKLQDAFDSLGAAVKDPAVRADFKEMGVLVKDALSDTFSSVSSDVGDVVKKATNRGDSDSEGTDAASTASDPGPDGTGADGSDEAPSGA